MAHEGTFYRATMGKAWRGQVSTFYAPDDVEACWYAKALADDKGMHLMGLEHANPYE